MGIAVFLLVEWLCFEPWYDRLNAILGSTTSLMFYLAAGVLAFMACTLFDGGIRRVRPGMAPMKAVEHPLDEDESPTCVCEFCATSSPAHPSIPATLEAQIQEFLVAHPNYLESRRKYPHLAIQAMVGTMRRWLMRQRGGPLPFYTAMLAAAKKWFPPGDTSDEFRVFCNLFEGAGNISWGGRPEFAALDRDYGEWRLRVRNPPQAAIDEREEIPVEHSFHCPECGGEREGDHQLINRTTVNPEDPWNVVLHTIACGQCCSVIPAHLAQRWSGRSADDARREWRTQYRRQRADTH